MLQHLSQGKPFNQNLEGHSFAEFQAIAVEREKVDEAVDWTDDSDIYKHVETQYWNYVENQVGSEYRVEYAADLNADLFGNGFGMPNQKLVDKNQQKYANHPWNFANF